MALGYVLLAAGLVATGPAHGLVPLAAATVLWSLGDLVLLGRATAVVAGLAPAGARGGYLATYGIAWGVAAVVGPLVGTRLFAVGGPLLLWSVLGAVCLGLAVAQPVVRRAVSGAYPSVTLEVSFGGVGIKPGLLAGRDTGPGGVCSHPSDVRDHRRTWRTSVGPVGGG